MNCQTELFFVPGTIDLCNYHTRANGHSAEKTNQACNQQCAGSNCRRCGFPDNIAYKDQIYCVVQLLYKASEQ